MIVGDRIGDALTVLPLLRSLRKRYPKSEMTLIFMRDGAGKSLLLENIEANEVTFGIDHRNNPENARRVLRKLGVLRAQKFDIAVDVFPSTTRTALLMFLLNAKKRIGTKWFLNKMNFVYDVTIDCEGKKSVDINKEIFEAITGSGIGYDTNIDFQLDKRSKITDKRGQKVAIFLGSDGDIGRIWDVKKWKRLLELIHKRHKELKFVSIGSMQERLNTQRLSSISRFKIEDRTGQTNVYDTMAFLRTCICLIATDGGPVHMAAINNVPVLVIMGNSPPQWRSFSSASYVMDKDHDHGMCWKAKRCIFSKNGESCTDFILPEDVAMAFENKIYLQKRKFKLK